MTPRRRAATVAAFALYVAAGIALWHTVNTVAWPALAALLRHYGIAS